jgi:hypothetical protein
MLEAIAAAATLDEFGLEPLRLPLIVERVELLLQSILVAEGSP